jgi:hypothetical protein
MLVPCINVNAQQLNSLSVQTQSIDWHVENAAETPVAAKDKPNPNAQASASHLDNRQSGSARDGRQKERGIGASHSGSSSVGMHITVMPYCPRSLEPASCKFPFLYLC